jgi:diguanylate cyclase (GGDEF)-like protein
VVRAARREQQPAVVLVDVDGFRHLNDGLGHPAGDKLLAAVAQRLQQCVRGGDTVARLSGDAFAILLEDTENDQSPAVVAERVLTQLDTITVDNQAFPLTASIGIASHTPGGQNPDDLLRNADTAMSEAKAAGKGLIAVYDRSMKATIATQLELQVDLQRAIDRKEFLSSITSRSSA